MTPSLGIKALYTIKVNKIAARIHKETQMHAHIYGNLAYDAYRSLGGKPECSINDARKNGLPVWKINEIGPPFHPTQKSITYGLKT